MTSILIITLLCAILGSSFWFLYMKPETLRAKKKTESVIPIIAVTLIAVAAHIIGAVSYYGHQTDMQCFIGWSEKVFSGGISSFYTSEGFHDYPPGYVYVMYVLGGIKNLLKLSSGTFSVFVKTPAMLADILTGLFVYKISSKKFSSALSAAFAALIMINPSVILNSSIWGQVDSVLSILCLLAVYLAAEKKTVASFFAFAAALLVKPQALFFAPVLIYAVIEEVWLKDGFSLRKLINYFLYALGAVAAMVVLFMPFGRNPAEGIAVVFRQYFDTIGQYNYMSVNAFNIYGAIGKNWAQLGVVSTVFGYLMICVVIAFSAYVFFKGKDKSKYYLTASVLSFGIYMLSVKMHERYAFPVIFMMMFALIYAPSTGKFNLFGLLSLSQFFNMAWILFIYQQDINLYYKSPVVVAASLVNILLTVYFVFVLKKECIDAISAPITKNTVSAKKQTSAAKIKDEFHFVLSKGKTKISKKDILIIAVITVIYSVIALYNLGSLYAPQTETAISENTVTVDLGSDREISKTEFFLGARQLEEDRNLVFTFFNENKEEVFTDNVTSGSVFYWTIRDTAVKARYVTVSAPGMVSPDDPTDKVYVREICFLDADSEPITPVNTDNENIAVLFDEQDMVVKGKSFMAETYFDEIYHARTAYEFINKMSVYEWTHPPLGKIFIGIGILLFGMVPFGWRIIGTLFGIFMIPVMYILAKRMLKHSFIALTVCLLFTFDFMHFSQTRIATIDVYVTFFIILMYYYMYKYYSMSFYDTPLRKTLVPLGLSGLFFGFAVACKWTGLYAGAGLAVIFFYTVYLRYREYLFATENPKGETDTIQHSDVITTFRKNTVITLLFCVIMFIALPAMIYSLSYIPYLNTPSGDGLKTIFTNANSMFVYHSKTVADSTHPYASHWFEWPIMYRPIWYFSNTLDSGLKQGISSFGNPAVWWLGIFAVAYMAALTVIIPLKKRNYFGRGKGIFALIYSALFAVCCILAYAKGNGNEKLVRLFPAILLYSCIMVSVFITVLLYDKSIKQTSNAVPLFLIIGYLAELMPWMLVVRTTYIYHYFPCVPFTVLMLGYSIKTFYDNSKNKKSVIIGAFVYAAVAVVLFAMFYPVLSGQPCNYEYAQDWLKWFDSWVLL